MLVSRAPCVLTSPASRPRRAQQRRRSEARTVAAAAKCGSSFEPLISILDKLQESQLQSPMDSLERGRWVKLICGASFEDVTEVRNLSLVYTLAGVDCIDCAADHAVVTAVSEGIRVARKIASELGYIMPRPWIMVSINDDEDPHFRKADFNSEFCPSDCPRPCERVCPASAIHFDSLGNPLRGAVLAERCYGCGRCIPICPIQNIEAKSYTRSIDNVCQLLCGPEVNAVEIHTGRGHLEAFDCLLRQLTSALKHVNLLAVSCPDLGDSMIPIMASMYDKMQQHNIACPNLWQLDGRPMSGDIGKGATKAAVSLALRVASAAERPPGFLQLAGGTNSHTIDSLHERNSVQGINYPVAGIAYGGYARKIVSKHFSSASCSNEPLVLEDHPELMLKSVSDACDLTFPVKSRTMGRTVGQQ